MGFQSSFVLTADRKIEANPNIYWLTIVLVFASTFIVGLLVGDRGLFDNPDDRTYSDNIKFGFGQGLVQVIIILLLPYVYRLICKPKLLDNPDHITKETLEGLNKTIKSDVGKALQFKVLGHLLIILSFIVTLYFDNDLHSGNEQSQVADQIYFMLGPINFASNYLIIIYMVPLVISKTETDNIRRGYQLAEIPRDGLLFSSFVYSVIAYWGTLLFVNYIIAPLVFLPLGIN